MGLLRRVVEELREKTWELDTNKRNNLVLYGVREEASPGNTEWAVREVSYTAGIKCPQSFLHTLGEGPYWVLLLVESTY